MSENDKTVTDAGLNPAAANGDAAQSGTDPKAGATDSNPNLSAVEQELEEHKKFVAGITPLLSKLDANPELVKAVLADKIDQKLATALLDGKVKVEEAQQIAEAHAQVKQDLGKEAYEKIDPNQLNQMIATKAAQIASETVEQKLKEFQDEQEWDKETTAFIANTPDFNDYAEGINKWLNEHRDISDMKIAYWAVKGQALDAAAAKQKQQEAGEAAKEIAANAGGGSAPNSGKAPEARSMWDQLVAPKSNPNNL